MVRDLAKGVVNLLDKVTGAEYSERSHQVEFIGIYNDLGKRKDVICTVQLKHYIPREVYGEPGFFYEKERERKVRNPDRKWIIIKETVTYYELSEADKKFIYVNYVYNHLNQRQISKLSGIPQPYVYRYIKHMKLKPKYEKTPKSKRNIDVLDALRDALGLDESVLVDSDTFENEERKVELTPDDNLDNEGIDFEKDFHVDPYPTRSEWKVRREKLGLKNGENWRNHNDADGEIGPKQYGDGSTARRKKVAKQKRKEKRRIKNIQKFNLHQNNRYNMTEANPLGDKDKIKFEENNEIAKKNIERLNRKKEEK